MPDLHAAALLAALALAAPVAATAAAQLDDPAGLPTELGRSYGFSGLEVSRFNDGLVGLTSGDLDGDGVADLLAGAPRAPEGEHPYLEPSNLSTRGRVLALSAVSGDVLQAIGPVADVGDLGFAVAPSGDLTGDGVADLLIGAPGSNVPLQSFTSGSAHVFSGNLADWGAPLLSGDGDLVGGTPVTISITGGPAFAPVVLIAGFAEVPTKLKGGVLSPTLDLLFAGLALNSIGQLDLPGTWPVGVPSATSLWLQAWMPAPAGPKGFYASNGLQLLTP